ncbi:hypothetical protein Sjap_010167 [Stephania japonica]|uniref:Btz domain-containing protein n=1 Tax=Stephania japonica TaxID=461633 RepID=A0AAP0J9W1_9MAGN
MPRREGRDYDSNRTHSKFDREPSPKRSRRDDKPVTERTSSGNRETGTVDRVDQDQKRRRRLQDPLPLEAHVEPESKVPSVGSRALNNTVDEQIDGVKHSSDPTKVPRSRSFFQHDERDIAGQDGRSFNRRATSERGWWKDHKDQSGDRDGGSKIDARHGRRDPNNQVRGSENEAWRHDGFYELEANAAPPARKRPAFREKKPEPEIGNASGVTGAESGRPSQPGRQAPENTTREKKEGRYPLESDRIEKPSIGDHASHYRGERQRVGFPSRDRFTGNDGSRGRDRFNGRNGERNQYRPPTVRAEKWKHDMFDEANRSPTPKNEDDQIAKIEALLAS